MKKVSNKPNSIAEIVVAIILFLYTAALFLFSQTGYGFFDPGITLPEQVLFWSTAVIGIAAFFVAVNSELRYGSSRLYRFFCTMVVCAGFLPLIANVYAASNENLIFLRFALGFTALGLILTGITRSNTVTALVCFALTAAGVILPMEEQHLPAWVMLLFLLPVISAVSSCMLDRAFSLLRITFCLICCGLCITSYLHNRSFYFAAVPCCILYTLFTVWLNARGLKRLNEQKKQSAAPQTAADDQPAETDAPLTDFFDTAYKAKEEAEKTAAAPDTPTASASKKTPASSARQIQTSIAQEFAMSERFQGILAFLLDTDGTWYRYSRAKKDIFPCDDLQIQPLSSLLEKESSESVIRQIRSEETCDIPCKIWDNRLCKYTDALIRSVTLPDGKKYVLAFDIGTAVTGDKEQIAALEQKNSALQSVLDEKEKDEQRVFRAINESFISLIENRSEESVNHLNNISMLTALLLKKAQTLFPEKHITDEYIRDISNASIYHNIGKIKIPDALLSKTEKYTPEEYEQVKMHTIYGGEIINRMPYTASQEQMLKYAYEIAVHHHERADGTGYPHELSGDQIPFYVQIVSLADAYEEMICKRVYKDEITFDDAIDMICEKMRGAYTADVLKCFKNAKEELRVTQLA